MKVILLRILSKFLEKKNVAAAIFWSRDVVAP
jgi:hypothetical protein